MRAEPAAQAWAVDPLPELASTSLRVDWPAAGLDPFDVLQRSTQRMMLAAGFTRAWLAAEGTTPASDERDPQEAIPRGYAGLSLLEKLAVVHRGRLIAEWPRATASLAHESARLLVLFQRTTGVWAAREPRWLHAARAGEPPAPTDSGQGPLAVAGHDDYAATVDLALGLSAAADDEPLMIVDVIDSWDWH